MRCPKCKILNASFYPRNVKICKLCIEALRMARAQAKAEREARLTGG
jgi:hypothetical protein